MKCPYGHADLERRRVPFTEVKHGYDLILRDVPAWVCPECGETLFDGETVDFIIESIKALDERILRTESKGGSNPLCSTG